MRDRLSLEEVGQHSLACTGLSIRGEKEARQQRPRRFSAFRKANDTTKPGFRSLCAPAILANNGHLHIQSLVSSPLNCEQTENIIDSSAFCTNTLGKTCDFSQLLQREHLPASSSVGRHLSGSALKQLYRSHSSSAQLLQVPTGRLPRRGFHSSHNELPRLRQEDLDVSNFACSNVDLIQQPKDASCLAIQTMRMTLQERTPSRPALPERSIDRRQSAKDQSSNAPAQLCEGVEAAQANHAGSYLCNWGAVDDFCLATLLDVLVGLGWDKELEDSKDIAPVALSESPRPTGRSHCIFDLGCGDGRVVIEVCKRFALARGVGIELNGSLVLSCQARAKRQGDELCERCNFRQEDLTKTRDLRSADVIFLYLPKLALNHVVGEVLPKSDIRNGTNIFTADEPLPEMPDLYSRVSRSRQNHEARRLFWYTWNNLRGSQNGTKPSWIPP